MIACHKAKGQRLTEAKDIHGLARYDTVALGHTICSQYAMVDSTVSPVWIDGTAS